MNELTIEYTKAIDLDRRIKISAQLAQQNLYEVCKGLKEMRDEKLYKQLGYQNFEEYSENEIGIKRAHAYRLIDISSNMSEEFVSSMRQIGTTKLALLAKLDEPERAEITENTDLESTTVKQLEEQIKELKNKNAEIAKEAELDRKEQEDANAAAQRFKAESEKKAKEVIRLEEQITNLNLEIEELKHRPIEVAVAEPSADERLLKETIKSLERENIRQNDLLEKKYREENKQAYDMFKRQKDEAIAEKEKEVEELKKQLEAAKSSSTDEDKTKTQFKIYLTTAYDSLKRLISYAKGNAEFKERTLKMLDSCKNDLEV